MATEDFTTYTEVDEDSDITVASNQCTIDTIRRDALSYVRDSKGSNHFGDFEHLVQTKITYADTRGVCGFWGISNGYSTIDDCRTNDDGMGAQVYRTAFSPYRIYIEEFTGGTTDYQDFAMSLDTDYYCTIERDGTTLTCKIYDDANRTNLLDTLSLTVDNTLYEYIFAVMSGDLSSYPDQEISFITKDLDLQEGETHFPTDTAKASDSISKFAVDKALSDLAKASDSISKFAVEHGLTDLAKASDQVTYKAKKTLNDLAKASDLSSYDYGGGETHYLTDTAKASDSISKFAVEKNLTDLAKASDSLSLVVKKALSDTAKASDSFYPKAGHLLTDLAKASDSISKFAVEHRLTDLAKASDNISFHKTGYITLNDTAKASDNISFNYGITITIPTENLEIYR